MYALEIKTKALKEIASLPRKDQKRIFAALDLLVLHPLMGKQLQGEHKGLRSVREWPYRILYTVDHRIVTVVKVGHRKDVYR